ncbi:siderophore-interacting protein [Catenuloplanes japonicus]|uniref:siderophore-interacting protein n=1 Tax=Catenuloplanes japonicus TaxID=33876 RepID=UPI0012F7E345|nr:SIP domain-containing protein [Catenuloplanes japonicus]
MAVNWQRTVLRAMGARDVHEPTGPAARWARQAAAGDTVDFSFTPARLAPDPGIGTYVLAGDASALPAINSLLGALPDGARTHVILTGDHDDAASVLRPRAGTTVTVTGTGAEQVACLGALDLDHADCYVWAAGERQDVAAVRDLVRKQWRLPKDRQHTQYYWIRGKAVG